jgi:hypothetical protein
MMKGEKKSKEKKRGDQEARGSGNQGIGMPWTRKSESPKEFVQFHP